MKRFYVDTCIWLNLFKKEGDASKGVPYWKIAEKFIVNVTISESSEIIYSPVILREIESKLGNNSLFEEKLKSMSKENKFRFVDIDEEDKIFARKLESESSYEISFYDCMHIAICKRLGLILVTRDKKLLDFAASYIDAEKPENLFIPLV